MRKRNMSHSNYQDCCICSPVDDEVISITDALLQQIRSAMGLVKKESAQLQCSKLQPLDFTRLLKMIFNKRFKNLKATTSCKHNDLRKTFAAKLDCSTKQVDKISSIISWKIAKFNFHTDVVILQSKSFLRHLTQSQETKQSVRAEPAKKKQTDLIQNSIKKQMQQKDPEHIIMENSINLSRLSIGHNISEANFNHFAYVWPVPWQPTQFLFTHPESPGQDDEKIGPMIPTFNTLAQ